jgi:uncharacterized protein YfaS (alpha-2-macroglobulin family)
MWASSRQRLSGWGLFLVFCLPALAQAVTVQTFSPQGEVALVRQVRATFSESMVPLGDPKQPAPFDLDCAPKGAGRWIDDKTWVFDFEEDVPPGTRCALSLKPGLASTAGHAITGKASFQFSTGGPAVVRAYPYPNGKNSAIEEEQAFALLLNGPATPESVQQHAYCAATGIGERIGIQILTGAVRDAILQNVHLVAQKERALVVRCQRPLPEDADVTLVWGKGIAAASGVPTTSERKLAYHTRPPFTANFTCERENEQASCLPIRPLRLEFSAPVPRKLAGQIVLVGPDGTHQPLLEHDGGQEEDLLVSARQGSAEKSVLFFGKSKPAVDEAPDTNAVSAVRFAPPFPENAHFRIEIPKGMADDSGRPLANAAMFPLATQTTGAPPIAKFASAPFGILELNADPLLPVTVRHVEPNLAIKGLPVPAGTVRDLSVSADAQIMHWIARMNRYHETSLSEEDIARDAGRPLPPPPAPLKAKGRAAAPPPEPVMIETRTLSLLATEPGARALTLPPAAADAAVPFEVIGVPLPSPGLHIVEIASEKLGAALLGKPQPMYVRTAVLVTNLGVHFKRGPVNSGVWVTTLDHAEPVAGAQIRISNCRAEVVWEGVTDAKGYAAVARALPEETSCDLGAGLISEPNGYFVSARKTDEKGRADMAFVYSSWQEGIEPWRFHLSSGGGYAETDTLIAHTVMDRTLLRAGQTVSMKHYARTRLLVGLGLVPPGELPDTMTIEHVGSGQTYKFPLSWRDGRYADSSFVIPADAKLGLYTVSLSRGNLSLESGEFRVEEFRLPVLAGRLVPPAGALVQPSEIPLSLQVNYGNGGGAAGLAVKVSADLRDAQASGNISPERFPGFVFDPPAEPGTAALARSPFSEPYVGEDDEAADTEVPAASTHLVADKVAVTLDAQGAGHLTLKSIPAVRTPKDLQIEATYADPNGEIQTLSQTVPLWPSAVVLGVRTESWVSVRDKLATQVLALDTSGKPQAGVAVTVRAIAHRTQSIRKRLVGGFYAFDNRTEDADLGEFCHGTSDARGLVLCDGKVVEPGNVELIAEAHDAKGNLAQAASSVWITREGEVWFGAQNDDRMDVIAEQRHYEPGETARFQVRMPFRSATALVAIERDGILETRTVSLSGKDPTIEIPVKAEWAPNVFVSVLAVRGRLREVPWYSLFTWGWRQPVAWWHAFRDEGKLYQAPTALVDLSRPAFRYGIGEIDVGDAAHRLKVDVTSDHPSYPIRSVSQVHIHVTLPNGQPAPAGSEVALAAVDRALLELMPNVSWDLLSAMVQRRSYGVETATAQMQIIGKRHFGKKAQPTGGGGGQFPTRELLDTLLVWNGRVVLNDKGEATVPVTLNDALTSFEIVAVADVVTAGSATLFGTGRTEIRSTQDLQIISGLPPVVREGDHYRAMVTLRNTTTRAMDAVLKASVGGATSAPAELPAQTVHLEPGAAVESGWDVEVPLSVARQDWVISADAGSAGDRLKLSQKVGEATPVTVQQATLLQLEHSVSIPAAAPAGALADATGHPRGGIDVGLKPRLADGLAGVESYFARYPWHCLEQEASIAIGLHDSARWKRVMATLPLYLDADGLANYFPPGDADRAQGSDTLTAYLLSISAEAASPEFAIPPDLRAKMEAGLTGFVEGRIKRDFWVPEFAQNGNLDVRKLAALDALSRTGHARARMLGSIQILPNQWPTAALIDWLGILDRIKDIGQRTERIAEAEQILRARLNVAGTRLGFSTERDDNWWWVMANGDVNSVRLILAVLDHPGWKEDLPRIVTGTLQRLEHGHWSTTPANAWGTLAIAAFSRRFEHEAVTGTTTAKLGADGVPQTLEWSVKPEGGALTLAWPLPAPAAASTINVLHEGAGKPWLTLASRAAVPLDAPFAAGYQVQRSVVPVEEKVKGQVSRGDVWRVHLDVTAQADMTWVVLSDPIPSGAAHLGTGLGRDSSLAASGQKEDWRGWLAYEERAQDGYRAYYAYLPKGKLVIEYTIRLNNTGVFGLPPTRIEAMYAPEVFGAAPNAPVHVIP